MKLKLVVGLLVLIILAFTVFGEHGVLNLVRYERQEQALNREAARLKKENAGLRREIYLLKNDPGRLERIAREDLGMVKAGEIVFQFADPRAEK